MDTLCGYGLADVRKTLWGAIDRRELRAAHRWTAELVATPGAVGSLWASFWVAWASAQGAGGATPTLPILLAQTWDKMSGIAYSYEGDWVAFRNDPSVRALAGEMVIRLVQQPRRTPVVWPKREIIAHDVEGIRGGHPPVEADGFIVTRVWRRGADSMELRLMAGRWLVALREGDLRTALSVVAWTLMTPAQQGMIKPLQVGERGPVDLPPKARCSPLWFWLEIGRLVLIEKDGLHKGWVSMHTSVAEAFRLHYRRWSAADRMRVLLAWILQVYSSWQPNGAEGLWDIPSVSQRIDNIDLPYKELAAELADPARAVVKEEVAPTARKIAREERDRQKMAMESKMAEADAAIMAVLGVTDDD